MKRLLLLIPLLLAGCGAKLSEEGEARCLEEAGYEQSNFVAEKVYERCSKNIMNVIREEKRFAREQEAKRKAMAARLKTLELKRNARIKNQLKEFDKYSDWKFWATRLTFPGEIVKPNCIIYETTKVLYQEHDWRDRYGNRRREMDNQVCWAPGSIVFNEEGFKYIDITAYYLDIGGNPPGPRGNGYEGESMNFPIYDITAEHINCITKEYDVQNIARVTRLLESDPMSFGLGQGDRAERFRSVTDPVTQKKVIFSKPLWVVKPNRPKYSLGRVLHAPTLNKIVNPTCNAHSKFWSHKNFSG